MEFTTGNSKVDAMAAMHLTGNIIPQIWYKNILRENGKPDLLAIIILADICYWYRPTELRDERTGQFLGYAKKFKDKDLLQRSYAQFADMFGESKRSITDAIVRLEKLGVIRRVFRTLDIGGMRYNNVLFIDLFPEKLYQITYPELDDKSEAVKEKAAEIKEDDTDNTPVPKFRERGHVKKGEGSRNLGTQNTNITTEITTKNLSSSKTGTQEDKQSILSGTDSGSDDEEDSRIRERLAYDTARKKYPKKIVEIVYEELKNRSDRMLYEISATDFLTICENISLYAGTNNIYHKRAFVQTCLDNLMIASVAGSGGVKCRGKPNPFNQFKQHDYDFDAIENAIMEQAKGSK